MSLLCAISGEAPQDPVVSAKSGNVFEKRLIEAYVSENGKDPVTGEDLTTDDLVALKSSRIVRPRPPTLTSIPSLLSVFQNEWDALALETFTLRQHLTQTRQELSSALYENDAAKRVIARLSRERDEARDALSKIGINGAAASNGDGAMQVDSQELPPSILAKVEETQERLSKTRRKRAVPSDWVTSEALQEFKPIQSSQDPLAGAQAFATHSAGDLVLYGGEDGQVSIYSTSQGQIVERFAVRAAVTDAVWADNVTVVATAAGSVEGYEAGAKVFSFNAHSGEARAVTLHPCGDLLASVGSDKTFVFYDLMSASQVLQVSANTALNTAQFHPDGHLFAAGGADGQIKVFDVKTGANAANFDEAGPLRALSFSENGTWLAAAVDGSSMISIWDLRKSAQIKAIDTGGSVLDVQWDYTGQFLASAGTSGITVQQYSKSTKEWSEPLRSAVAAVAVGWGSKGQNLFALGSDGIVTVLGAT